MKVLCRCGFWLDDDDTEEGDDEDDDESKEVEGKTFREENWGGSVGSSRWEVIITPYILSVPTVPSGQIC